MRSIMLTKLPCQVGETFERNVFEAEVIDCLNSIAGLLYVPDTHSFIQTTKATHTQFFGCQSLCSGG